MKNVLSIWGAVLLCGVCLAVTATERAAPENLQLKISRGTGGTVQIQFASVPGRIYQAFVSSDLIQWDLLGDSIEGTGGILTFDYVTRDGRLGFFKIISRSAAVSVPLTIERGTNQIIQLSFQSIAGKAYLFYGSGDLKRWVVLSEFVQGVGGKLTFDYDTGNGSEAYFTLEEAQLAPITNMIRIPAGSFVMGSPLNEKDRDLDEDPLTQVTFGLGFWMGKYEVTQKEYENLMKNNPSAFQSDPNQPVEQVSWEDAAAYCARLTELERAAGRLPAGFAYRLPTEAEFEYACRAGSTNRYSFGDDPNYTQLGDYAWFDKNSGNSTHPVGQKKANAFGLYDMNGNVWEWCLDWYRDPYPGGSVMDPAGPTTGQSRVFRGGGWDYVANSCRSAYRNNVRPTEVRSYLGFRVVLSAVHP
jgi:formylglycine-generating enzyme required for sulfatase activity